MKKSGNKTAKAPANEKKAEMAAH
jgi:hypothetical protein